MATKLDAPVLYSRWLVEFTWGASSALRVTDQEEDVAHSGLGVTFEALPRLEIALPPNTGGLEEKPLELTVVRSSKTLFQNLSSSEPHAPVTVKVWEELYDDPATSSTYELLLHYHGQVSKAVRNYQNAPDLVLLEALTLKSRLDVPMGLPANPQCVWTLADGVNCTVTATPQSGTLASVISGPLVEITGLSPPGGDASYFQRGYVEVDGLRIGIRKWDSGSPDEFHLRRRVPASWVGGSVSVVPGCDKTIEVCRSRWSNEEQFGGFGYAIPNYQPNYESPF